MDARGGAWEQAVAGHGEVDARASQNHRADAAGKPKAKKGARRQVIADDFDDYTSEADLEAEADLETKAEEEPE